jgi:hypothetical protein
MFPTCVKIIRPTTKPVKPVSIPAAIRSHKLTFLRPGRAIAIPMIKARTSPKEYSAPICTPPVNESPRTPDRFSIRHFYHSAGVPASLGQPMAHPTSRPHPPGSPSRGTDRVAPQKHMTLLTQAPTPATARPVVNAMARKSMYRYSNTGRMIALEGFDGET